MDVTFEVPVYNSSELGCRFMTFFAHMSDFNCVWMISWISCDRAIVLFRPGKWYTRSQYYFVVINRS